MPRPKRNRDGEGASDFLLKKTQEKWDLKTEVMHILHKLFFFWVRYFCQGFCFFSEPRTFFRVFGICIRIFFPGLSRVDAAEGDANWPGNSWNRGKFQPPPNPPDRNRIFTRLTGRPYSKRFFEILKARRKLPCEMAQNFCRFFLGVDQQQRLFLCSTVSKIVVKIFQVIIIYTYRYSIQCTYTFITVLYVWKKKHARSLEACNLLMRLKKSSSLTW